MTENDKSSGNLSRKLRNFLNTRWLRPESALFGTLESRAFDTINFRSPSIDISCGDGSLMFQHFGGEVDISYDVFIETCARDFKHDKFIDIFNHNNEINPMITKKPNFIMDVATDWKKSLLKKAEKFGVYRDLVVHDNNVLPLPFEDNYFETVFSTAVYWVQNIPGLLADAHRITKPGGQLVITGKTPTMLSTLDWLRPLLSDRAIAILDRKRVETMPGGANAETWHRLVSDAGFEVERIESLFPATFLIDIWNVGLRPIAHLLVQMADEIRPERRIEIKREWVDITYELLYPLVSMPNQCPPDRSPYLLIVGRKCR